MATKHLSGNQKSGGVGGIAKAVGDEFIQTVKQTGQQIADEPRKILEQILGGSSSQGPAESSIEDLGKSGDDPAAAQAQMQQIQQKQMEDKQMSAQALQMHRQRLAEEEQYFRAKKQQKDAIEDQQEKQEEEQQKHEIVQLKRQKDVQLAAQTQGRLGSHEGKAGKY